MALGTTADTTPAASETLPYRRQPRGLGRRIWHDRWLYLFLLPTAVLYTMYTLWPIAASYWYSLLDWNGFEREGTFIGLDNYRRLLDDTFFRNSMRITLVFAAVTVPIRVFLALFVAIMLNNKRLPWANAFRTALFLPVVTTTAIIGVVMAFVFDPVGGPANTIMLRLGLVDTPVNFLGDSDTALYTVMGVHIWKWFGVTLIYWLAALQTIPEDLYEAARVDGGNPVQVFFGITLPLLKPFLLIILTLTVLDTLEIFDLMLTMTNGGPFYSTEVIDIFIYRQAFASASPQLGYASAAAVAFGFATLILAIAQLLAFRYGQRFRRSIR